MIKEWVNLYTTTNLSTRDIGKMYNCSETTVNVYLTRSGVVLYHKKRPSNKYYRNKYMIALYDMNDNLYKIFNNVYDMSKGLNRPYNSIHRTLLPDWINKKIRINGEWYRKVLIEVC